MSDHVCGQRGYNPMKDVPCPACTLTAPERVVRAGVVRGESGLLCAYQEAYLVELEADTEAWIVLAPHDQPPVPADVAAQREREAFEAGMHANISYWPGTPEHMAAIDAAFAAYQSREGER